jgi:hypothetical protein
MGSQEGSGGGGGVLLSRVREVYAHRADDVSAELRKEVRLSGFPTPFLVGLLCEVDEENSASRLRRLSPGAASL